MDKSKEILKFSNPTVVKKKAEKYFGKHVPIYLSTRNNKKYMLQDSNNRWVHFGQMGYEDYTVHHDDKRRDSYLKRSKNISGNWKNNMYSPNNLSIHLLW